MNLNGIGYGIQNVSKPIGQISRDVVYSGSMKLAKYCADVQNGKKDWKDCNFVRGVQEGINYQGKREELRELRKQNQEEAKQKKEEEYNKRFGQYSWCKGWNLVEDMMRSCEISPLKDDEACIEEDINELELEDVILFEDEMELQDMEDLD